MISEPIVLFFRELATLDAKTADLVEAVDSKEKEVKSLHEEEIKLNEQRLVVADEINAAQEKLHRQQVEIEPLEMKNAQLKKQIDMVR